MSRFSIALIRLATLALLGSAGTAAYAQKTIDQNKALAGNVTPGDAPGFPITISVPGSYKLMSNLQVPQGTAGITITASRVTLDLNGFTIEGPNVCTINSSTVSCSLPVVIGAHGVAAFSGTDHIVVRNGNVQGMQDRGVFLRGSSSTVSGLHVAMNRAEGLYVFDGQIQDALARLNGGHGFGGTQGTLIMRSVAKGNGGDGFNSGVVHESISHFNKGFGATYLVRGVHSQHNAKGNFAASSRSMGGNYSENAPF